MDLQFRKAQCCDAANLLSFLKQLDAEADYLLFDKNERNATENSLSLFLEKCAKTKSVMFIAHDQQNKIIGFLFGEVQSLQRTAHVVKLNIGILKAYQRKHVAEHLALLLRQYAAEIGISRGEVTVIKENSASLALCQKLGFEIEGVKRHSVKIGNTYHDEYCLALLV